MIECVVEDPNFFENPLPEGIASDPLILYHGTCSGWSSVIETQGFLSPQSPINVEDIRQVLSQYKKMDWHGPSGGDDCLRKYGLDSTENAVNTTPSFTHRYRLARQYAVNIGGEILDSMDAALKDLDAYVIDGAVRTEHLKKIKKTIQDLSSRGASEDAVVLQKRHDYLNGSNALRSDIDALGRQREFCNAIRAGAFPVVYAIKTNINGLDFSHFSKDEFRALHSIPVEEIIAKVEYRNGAVWEMREEMACVPVSGTEIKHTMFWADVIKRI